MPQFYTVLTETGQAKMANAIALGTTINIAELAVGDGGGALPQPDSDRTTLVSQVRRAPVNRVDTDPDNPAWLIVEQVLPPDVGGWTIREVGLFDDAGDLIGYGNYPETYKPTLDQGSGRTLTIRMVLEVSDTAAVTLQVDPAVVLATREHVDDSLAAYGLGEADPGVPVLDDFANASTPTGFYRGLGLGTPNPTPNAPPGSGNSKLSAYALHVGGAVHWIVLENASNATSAHRLFFGNTHEGGVVWNRVWHDGNVGAGSGLNADLLDGFQAVDFPRKWSIGATGSATAWLKVATFTGGAGSRYRISLTGKRGFATGDGNTAGGAEIYVTVGNNDVPANNLAVRAYSFTTGDGDHLMPVDMTAVGDGFNWELWIQAEVFTNVEGVIWGSGAEFAVHANVTQSASPGGNPQPVNRVWHDGMQGEGSGLDADLLDGQHASFYRDASNLATGTMSTARLPAATENAKGAASVATQDEVDAGSNNSKIVTAKKLKNWAAGWVKQATETMAGMLKLATQEQVDTGSDDSTAVTPKKMRWGFAALFGDPGHLVLPSWLGGIIIQWGTASYNSSDGASGTVGSFPIAFPSACYKIVGGDRGAGINIVSITELSATQYRCWGKRSSDNAYANTSINFIALGK